MPALPAVANVFRTDVVMTFGEDIDVVNHQFWTYSTAPDQASADAFAAAAFTAWGSNMMTLFNPDLILTEVRATDLSSASGPVGIAGGSTAGGTSGNLLAANTAVCIKKHIARRYRGGHPRNYIAGANQADLVDPQTWTGAFITAVSGGYDAFQDALEAHTFGVTSINSEANVSYYQGFVNHTFPSGRVRPIPVLRGTPVVDVIDTVEVNAKVASQRRRALQSR